MPKLSEETKAIVASNLTLAAQIKLVYWQLSDGYEPESNENKVIMNEFDAFLKMVRDKF